ncbi:MAG: polysaccharide deacetylase family protein, partial [Desulfobulbia bacterium]
MIPILMYHQIADIPEAQNPNRYSVTPQMFESQMSYLTSRGYQCISLLDAVNHVRNKQRIPRKSIVITFDDGYLDFYINALPILERFGLVATIFVVAERVGYKSDWPGMQGQNSAELMNWTQLDEICRSGMTVGS